MTQVSYQVDQSLLLELKKCTNTIHTSRTHFHNELSIGLIEQGCCQTIINQKSFALNAGTLLIIPAKSTHRCQPQDVGNWKFRMLYVHHAWFSKFTFDQFRDGRIYSDLPSSTFHEFIDEFKRLEQNFSHRKVETHALDDLVNMMDFQENNAASTHLTQSVPQDIQDMKHFIKKNCLKKLLLDELADHVGVDKYQLIRRFYRYMGLTPQKYLINLRINKAKKMLQNGLPIADVAVTSGFYDQSHFSKYFKAYTGVTPMHYIQ
ncbi:AraC family transcriptional regulator [Sporolactobacillus sp. STSJ-5]|uniref:helix-turn-helix transcriptional regulator n=1 Tax=Sporolactobacillus sp. STSJ-5 TaxID=2965076 RepID=UPI002102FF81|nr:AraC family transcriptional regulator [Sporolactobacillus sp. STSJ-5]MCQ2011593.1 AraC family transcriptional regulator [Sporolactobacillus sp. STSJ-5]